MVNVSVERADMEAAVRARYAPGCEASWAREWLATGDDAGLARWGVELPAIAAAIATARAEGRDERDALVAAGDALAEAVERDDVPPCRAVVAAIAAYRKARR